MRYWDSSALVPLIIAEDASDDIQRAFEQDPELIVWWGTEIECVSALARRERDGAQVGRTVVKALERLDALSFAWREVLPAERVRSLARRLLRVHALRAADAVQLSAAIVAAEEQPATLPFVTLDERLVQAARREGFIVVRPGGAG